MQLRPKPLEVQAIENYCLSVFFDSGEIKIFDVKPLIIGSWYGQLKDRNLFESAKIVGNTIEWANGQAICPYDLYYSSVPV